MHHYITYLDDILMMKTLSDMGTDTQLICIWRRGVQKERRVFHNIERESVKGTKEKE